jgi:hypothetical protein
MYMHCCVLWSTLKHSSAVESSIRTSEKYVPYVKLVYPHKIKPKKFVHPLIPHKIPGVREKSIQVTFLQDRSVQSHENPYVKVQD